MKNHYERKSRKSHQRKKYNFIAPYIDVYIFYIIFLTNELVSNFNLFKN